MKNILLYCLSLLLLTSCELTEKVYLDESGAVKYAMDIDLSQMDTMDKNKGSSSNQFPLDTILTANEMITTDIEQAEKMGQALENDMIREMFKDFKFHIKMDDKHKGISFFTEKSSTKELNQSLQDMERARQAYIATMSDSLTSEELSNFDLPIQSNLTLHYNDDSFERKGHYEQMLNPDSLSLDNIEGIMMSLMTYNIEYHFPKPVTSISDSTALTSFDRKTIYLRKSMNELRDNPEAYNFKVTFN